MSEKLKPQYVVFRAIGRLPGKLSAADILGIVEHDEEDGYSKAVKVYREAAKEREPGERIVFGEVSDGIFCPLAVDQG